MSLSDYDRGFHRVLSAYQSSARARNIDWGLTDEEVFYLVAASCHYCGQAPTRVMHQEPWTDEAEMFIAGGIDRADNSRGYFPANVVPACTLCNMAKGTLTVSEFLNLTDRISNHQRAR